MILVNGKMTMKTVNLLSLLDDRSIEFTKSKCGLDDPNQIEILYRYLLNELKAIPEDVVVNHKPPGGTRSWIELGVEFFTHIVTRGTYKEKSIIVFELSDGYEIHFLSQTSDELDEVEFCIIEDESGVFLLLSVASKTFIIDSKKEPFNNSGTYHYVDITDGRTVHQISSFNYSDDRPTQYRFEKRPITIMDYDS